MGKLIEKIVALFTKETEFKNDLSRTIVAYRIILSLMLPYCIMQIVCFVPSEEKGFLAFFIASLGVYIAAFALTYKRSALEVIILSNVWWLVWIPVSIYSMGWKINAQLFIVVLLILAFFSAYKKYIIKLCYAVLLLIYGMCMTFALNGSVGIIETSTAADAVISIIGYIITFSAITVISILFSNSSVEAEGRLVEYNIQLENEANTDALTGLYNRRKGRDHLSAVCRPGYGRRVVVAMLDIDFFKKVNDSYGHDVGDEVLKKIATTMRETFNKDTSMVRWGGEEFLIIMEDCNGDEACAQLMVLANKIRNLVFKIGDRSFSVTVTMGVEEYDYSSDVDTLVKRADEKLYQGKNSGRDRVVF